MSVATKQPHTLHRDWTRQHHFTVLVLAMATILALFFAALVFVFGVNRWNLDVTLNGESVQVLEYGSEYCEQGASARFYGTKLFQKGQELKVLRTGKVDTSKVGTYTLLYWGQKLGWTTTAKRTVIIQDTLAPVIYLTQDPEHYTLPGQPYEEEGYRAHDNYDGDITDKVQVTEADGIVTYTVSDSSGNTTTVHRAIVYDDPVPPQLTLQGEETLTLSAGSAYEEPGWSAADNLDGDLSQAVQVEGSVNTLYAGTYLLTYLVSDAHGNQARAQRTVVVEGNAVPEKKVVYLTFDDGPGPYTEELLDVLAKHGVKATFFTCTTPFAELMKREAEEGHTVAIHSASHEYDEIYVSEEAFFKDLYAQQDLIYEQTGIRPTLLRFPGGSSNEMSKLYCEGIMTRLTQAVEEQGFQYVDWNVLSGDAGETEDTDEIVENVINGIKKHDRSVVLQHDIHKFSVKAVDRIVTWGLNHGYTFLPLTSDSPTVHHDLMN